MRMRRHFHRSGYRYKAMLGAAQPQQFALDLYYHHNQAIGPDPTCGRVVPSSATCFEVLVASGNQRERGIDVPKSSKDDVNENNEGDVEQTNGRPDEPDPTASPVTASASGRMQQASGNVQQGDGNNTIIGQQNLTPKQPTNWKSIVGGAAAVATLLIFGATIGRSLLVDDPVPTALGQSADADVPEAPTIDEPDQSEPSDVEESEVPEVDDSDRSTAHDGMVTALAAADEPGGNQRTLSVGQDASLVAWDSAGSEIQRAIVGQDLSDIALSPNQDAIAVSGKGDGRFLKILDSETLEETGQAEIPAQRAEWSLDGRQITVQTFDEILYVDSSTLMVSPLRQQPSVDDSLMWSFAKDQKNELVAAGNNDGYVMIWPKDEREPIQTISLFGDDPTLEERVAPGAGGKRIEKLDWSPDGSLLLASAQDFGVAIIDSASWTVVGKVGDLQQANAAVFSPDGQQILATTRPGLGIYSVSDLGQQELELTRDGFYSSLHWSTSGRITAGRTDGQIVQWTSFNGWQSIAIPSS